MVLHPESAPSRGKLLEVITSPLAFFALALLIVEVFLGSGLAAKKLETQTAIWTGVSMFLVVVVMVFFLVWFKPENLIFNREAHLRVRGINPETPRPEVGPKKSKRSRIKKRPDSTLAVEKGETQ